MDTSPLLGNDALWDLPFTVSFLAFSSNSVKLKETEDV